MMGWILVRGLVPAHNDVIDSQPMDVDDSARNNSSPTGESSSRTTQPFKRKYLVPRIQNHLLREFALVVKDEELVMQLDEMPLCIIA